MSEISMPPCNIFLQSEFRSFVVDTTDNCKATCKTTPRAEWAWRALDPRRSSSVSFHRFFES